MDIERLKQELRALDTNSLTSVKVSFIEKRRDGLTCYVPEISSDLRRAFVTFFNEVLNKNLFDFRQESYNELGKEDEVLEVTTLSTGSIEDTIIAIDNQENSNYDLSEMTLDKINYYVFKFTLGDKKFYFFRRFNKQRKLSKGIRGRFTGNSFIQMEEEVFGVDDDIDIIVYEDAALIINRYALQTIFDLSDYFLGKTDQAMRTLEAYKKINNFPQFELDCKNDRTATKRLTKIVNTPNLINGFFDNIHHLPNVINEMDLIIKLDKTGNVDYNGSREERTQILSCIADKFYITLLQGKIGEDKLK